MEKDFSARLYTGDTSISQSIQVRIEPGSLLLVLTGEKEERIPLASLELALAGHAQDRFQILSKERKGLSLLSEDHEFLAALAELDSAPELKASAASVLTRLQTRHSRARLYWGKVAIGTVLILLLLYFSIDFLATLAISNVDAKTEGKLGAMLADLYYKEKRVSSGSDFERVSRIGKRLVSNLEANKYKYEFKFFVKDDDTVNAVAFPGGTVFVHQGLLRRAESDDEIAGVMAHEIGHVVHRDSLKALAHQIGVLTVLQLLFGIGGDSEQLAAALNLANNLESLQYSRSQESAADICGVDLVFKSDYRGEDLLKFFERLEKDPMSRDNKFFALLSDHPMNQERIEAIRNELKKLSKK